MSPLATRAAQLWQAGYTLRAIRRELGISIARVYRLLWIAGIETGRRKEHR